MTSLLWRILRSRWKNSVATPAPGYTALLPLPADLPVFLKIATFTLRSQSPRGLVETLVIPDRPSKAFAAAFDEIRRNGSDAAIRLVALRPLDRWITSRINSPHMNHWLQLVNGVEAARTQHVLLHDADLFIQDKQFLSAQYAAIASSKDACFGVNPVWDPWYRENHLDHVTATWELMFDTTWARSFKPWMHRGHRGLISGRKHEFDTMLLPQALTPPSRIHRSTDDFGFIHFNYVICTYRWFQAHERKADVPYVDEHWRLLLIRLLVNAFESNETEAAVPSLPDLQNALRGQSKRVDYRSEAARANYPEFRAKLQRLLDGGILDRRQIESLQQGIAPFDNALGQAQSSHPSTSTLNESAATSS